jgi:hypothetical protein
MNFKPDFLLRVAKAIIEEVVEKRKGMSPVDQERVREEHLRDLRIAIGLCDQVQPGAIKPSAEVTVESVKAGALFQQGVIALDEGRWDAAMKEFEESLKVRTTQESYFNIAFCLLEMATGARDREAEARMEAGARALEKCIEIDPDTAVAVDAGKRLVRMNRLGQAPGTRNCPACGANVFVTATACDVCGKAIR